jgi:CBS domain-containing protein
VHRLEIVAADGSHRAIQTAYCPSRCAAVALAECKTCAHAHTASDDAVVCTPPGLDPSDEPASGKAALTEVIGVRGDVPGGVVAALARRTLWQLPVVDDEDRFVGFVSSHTLSSRPWPWRIVSMTPARDLVFGRFLAVRISDPLPVALRLMAHRGARAVALVDAEGVLQGVLSDIDALRALRSRNVSSE